MSVDTVTLFLAMLAGLAFLLVVAIPVSALTGDRFGINAALRPVACELAAAVAVTATVGSLYLSEVVGYEPCRLCWVQRGFMYPAAALLVVALVARSPRLAGGAGLLALIGLPISLFHRYDQATDSVGGFCDQANPCSLRWVEHFGFVTIPTMAAVGFAAIVALIGLLLLGSGGVTDDDTELPVQRRSTPLT